jgi:pimeloyl-ACP methyl ester carboxylesterase
LLPLLGCSNTLLTVPSLGRLYNDLARREDPYRNPIIVIPGLIGSRLVDSESGAVAWGAFGLGQLSPNSAAGAQLIALPMAPDRRLRELRDNVVPDGALDRVVVNFLGFPVQLNAYYNILRTLGAGGYRDQGLAEAGAVDYGERHFTCFQFAYDWRRDIVESAQALDVFIQDRRRYVQAQIAKRFGITDHPVKFDLVAHSMGSLVARYYLLYGGADLPADGSLPQVTWAGAEAIEHLVMIGPPNAGSVEALIDLVDGIKLSWLLPHYPAVVLGTMPAIYQLLPRSRHQALLDPSGQPIKDIFDPLLWQSNRWGLADPTQDALLAALLPDITDPDARQAIALEHQRKALARARQFTAAMDQPATPPPGLKLLLVAGDAEETPKIVQFDRSGALKVVETGPGDGTVLRASTLLDERTAQRLQTRLQSPLAPGTQVVFLFADHRGLTENPEFTDNLLYFLLESPRPPPSPGLNRPPPSLKTPSQP